MSRPRMHLGSALVLLGLVALLALPDLVGAQDFKEFRSDEYAFSMRFPGTWVKIDKPRGNYYVVFQSPEMTENFRSRIHVAAHSPVKDPLKVFLQELRNGIADLQKKSGAQPQNQEVRILDEGEFKCDVPGAYYFFIQAYEEKLKIWMDIVIVFYKQDQTLLRISCLAPSNVMERYHELFNEVLVSVKFAGGAAAQPQPSATAPAPARPVQPAQPPAPPSVQYPQPGAGQPQPVGGGQQQPYVQPMQPAQPPAQRTAPPEPPAASTVEPTAQPGGTTYQPTQPQPTQPPAPVRPAGPRGPAREPERGATGIVN